jgi:hypothetical protein
VNYIEAIADEIRRKVQADVLPDEDSAELFLIYAVLLLALGDQVSREDVHNAWCAWMSSWGADHEAIVPFSELSPETQAEDSPFVLAIRSVAHERGRPGKEA